MHINERLREAAKNGDEVELKALLLDPSCDVLSKDEFNMTALMWAAGRGRKACIEILLPVCDPSSKTELGWTALTLAARYGHAACLAVLLQTGDALAGDVSGMTPLMWAAGYGYDACVKILLPASDALAKDRINGKTANGWAQSERHDRLAQFIDDYVLAQSEQAAIAAVCPGALRRRTAPRV